MISLITSLILCVTSYGGLSPQDNKAELRRYSYTITGKVIFSKSQTLEGATVYVMPATRPINGRIPFTHADQDGRFSIEFKDVPDEYRVCAHPGETTGLMPIAHIPQEAETLHIKLTCGKALGLPEEDAERSVLLKLK